MIPAVLIFLTTLCICTCIFMWVFRKELMVEGRVAELVGGRSENSWETFQSLFAYTSERLTAMFDRMTPVGLLKRAEAEVRRAGIRGPKAVRRWLVTRTLIMIGAILTGVVMLLIVPSLFTFEGAVVLVLIGILGPRMYLARKAKAVSEQVRKGLPNFLDMLTISVEAGLGFDQALARTTKNMDTPLGHELRQVITEMGLGKTRRDALRDAANRVVVDEFRTFVSALVQADRLGMGIANVLRIQSDEARRKLRQKAEERAIKAPIKILFPLVVFLFPGLFLVILGPAILRIAHAFLTP